MNRIFLFLFSILLFSNAHAQNANAGQVLDQVYGAATTGCVTHAAEPTGTNRTTGFTANRRYIVYGWAADFSVGDALRCIWGGSSVDVNSLAASKVGQVIYAGQQQIFLVKGTNTAISCISKTAGAHYDVCPLE